MGQSQSQASQEESARVFKEVHELQQQLRESRLETRKAQEQAGIAKDKHKDKDHERGREIDKDRDRDKDKHKDNDHERGREIDKDNDRDKERKSIAYHSRSRPSGLVEKSPARKSAHAILEGSSGKSPHATPK